MLLIKLLPILYDFLAVWIFEELAWLAIPLTVGVKRSGVRTCGGVLFCFFFVHGGSSDINSHEMHCQR